MKDFDLDGILDVEEMAKALRRWAVSVYQDLLLQILDHRHQSGRIRLTLNRDKDRITAYIADESRVRRDAEQLVARNQEARDGLLRLKRRFASAKPVATSGTNGAVGDVDQLLSHGNGRPSRKGQSRKAEKARKDRAESQIGW